MTPDPQLKVMQVNAENIDTTGPVKQITFTLSRGDIARVLGFCLSMTSVAADQQYGIIVRKSRAKVRSNRPTDILWLTNINGAILSSIGAVTWGPFMSFNLPKPYRTTHLTIQFSASTTTGADMVLLIYYDVDKMIHGEATQVLEKGRLVGNVR